MKIVARLLYFSTETIDKLYPLIDSPDLAKYAKLFHRDIVMALSNQHSSLPCILNPISKVISHPGFGVAVSIGGTNGYVSAFRISTKGVLKFINRQSFSLPEQTTRENLFELMTKNIFEAAAGRKRSYPIGIGFAYPLKPLLTHHFIDGELIYMSKGRNIDGLVGKRVGQEYHKYLIQKHGFDTTVSVANDAICLLLGGDGAEIAGVMGTGLNFAYWEKRKKIVPLRLSTLVGFSKTEVAVNLESKNFDKIKGTRLLELIDKESDDEGYSLAEKEAAGAYLYRIFNAGKNQIIGFNFPILSATDELNDIMTGAYKFPDNISDMEKKLTRLFAKRIFQRSAQIVAIEICGILLKLGKTRGIVPVVMEGGIFWKAKNYTSLVNAYINAILPEVIPSFARLFGSSRRGIAILAKSVI